MTTTSDPQPFRFAVPADDLDDLRRRLTATRWPEPPPEAGADFGRGTPIEYTRDLVRYWADGYDWRAHEQTLNELGPGTATIDGQDIRYLHVRSPHADAVPLVLLHGYPSGVAEFVPVVGPLVDPERHGGSPGDAFHLVIPFLPGFGWSTPVRAPGWELRRTTDAIAALMAGLGYDRYGAFGGDIGAGVAGRLAAVGPEHVIGTLVASDPGSLGLAGEQFPIPDGLSEEDQARVERARAAWTEDRGYIDLQSHRPETIGLALTDSPVGQLAWIVEKFQMWTNPAAATPDEAVDRDLLLTIVSSYWFTRSGTSAARFLWETGHADVDWLPPPPQVPSGWAVFNSEPVMRRFFDPDHQIGFWADHPEGGHFPALEAPDLLVADLRAFFAPLR